MSLSRCQWVRAYGVADEDGRALTPTTRFQAALISKPVAAMAALALVDQGLLNLDADVNKYLTSWKVPANQFTDLAPVTLRGLLSHTAGLTVHGFPGYGPGQTVPGTIGVLDGEGNTDPVRVDVQPPGVDQPADRMGFRRRWEIHSEGRGRSWTTSGRD